MTTGDPVPLPDEDDLLLDHGRGFTPKRDVEEPDEAPGGPAGTSHVPPTAE
ncbi:hypothetical protein [Umezawaea tangerina]|uniref:Uncharacterized protein n=1 Tax=Umezawaea tangerina TaxID=84725 RepID=A0A2T0SXQ2_9PSEU|nr:hypothetical protein [Umezawaea tangerina]PRY38197.1 hypothetical protein CLV43_109418 [Umezawaea tangerina]